MSHIQKAAIVTGASKGIGYAVAQYLSDKGYTVLLISRNEAALKKVLATLGTHHRYAALDVSNAEAVKEAVDRFAKEMGRVDLLFNNAGYAKAGTSTLPSEEFVKMVNTNLVGTFNFVAAVAPYMKQQGSGFIMNLSSYSAKVARGMLGGYAASKFGVMGLNEALYKELAPFGISVTAICPNLVYTEMTASVDMPREKMLHTDDVVKTVDYLLNLSPAVAIKEIVLQCREYVRILRVP